MRRFGWKVSWHLVGAVLPYFLFSWVLLSVILFFQQASRYSDIFFSVSIPRSLIFQLTIALIPNVIAFTCPMAALVGVIIGLSKLQGDSELVAIRASGVGNLALTLPMLAFGVALSVFALFVNVKGVPFAAATAKRIGIQSALSRLETPIEPGAFNNNIAGLTVFVRDGDLATGIWRQLFLFSEDSSKKSTRLITARLGRIDAGDTRSELVLSDAIVTSLPRDVGGQTDFGYASERIGEVRFAINTGRTELLSRLEKADEGPEALGLMELAEFARNSEGLERINAQVLWARRVVLSITPFLFSLLGASMVLRFNRGGRGFGIFLALLSLIAYYILTLAGEQIARTTGVPPSVTGLLPVLSCIGVSAWFFISNRYFLGVPALSLKIPTLALRLPSFERTARDVARRGSRLMDRDIVFSILRYYLLTLGFLASVFVIFTAFDMWRFAGSMDGGVSILFRYLFFLLPMIYLQLAPPALMIGVLATFVIKSRQNEVVTWIAAGRSLYRLLLPAFALMVAIGAFNVVVQELVLPGANQRQDALRATLRSRGVSPSTGTKSWAATSNRIYSFDTPERGGRREKTVSGLSVFEFDRNGTLGAVYRAPSGTWNGESVTIDGSAEKITFDGGALVRGSVERPVFGEPQHPFSYANQRPAHLSTAETRDYLREVDSDIESRNMAVSLQKKLTTAFMPLMIVIFTAPFGLSLGRKGRVVTVGYAVAVWLVYMGVGNLFEQFGLSGAIHPVAAVWLPLLSFTFAGMILLSRIRT